jgi:ATP-dependent Clp protease ATP-binding subunit ClpX
VQQALLKIIEGSVASVPPQGGRKHPHQDFIQIDTSNILFICGGAFEGLERIVGRRTGRGLRTLGFNSDHRSKAEIDAEKAHILRDVSHDDLLQFGLIPEFVGRMPVVSTLDPLDVEMMTAILTAPKNAIARQFQRLFALDDVELVFTDDGLQAIAEEAIGQKTGARGLRTVVEDILLDVMYETPSRSDIRKCVVTAESVKNRTRPLLITESGQVINGADDDVPESA